MAAKDSEFRLASLRLSFAGVSLYAHQHGKKGHLTGQLTLSSLGYPISSSTLWPASGEAELRFTSRGTSYHRFRLAFHP